MYTKTTDPVEPDLLNRKLKLQHIVAPNRVPSKCLKTKYCCLKVLPTKKKDTKAANKVYPVYLTTTICF